MRTTKLFKCCLVALSLLVGGCSYSHEIHFSLSNGKLLLIFDDGKPVALQRLAVVELSTGTPTVWRLESLDYNGRDIGKLAYGAVLPGTKQTAAAKPLRVGQLYRVELDTIDGGGLQEFVISPEPENGQYDQITVVRE
jgi:hypothetical protein